MDMPLLGMYHPPKNPPLTDFSTLSTRKKQGHIEGEVSIPFMLDSTLPEEVLAQIW
jgi:hypothetical protein